MDLEELRAFLSVVETGSFLTAAKSLKLSRATLRRRIDQLEARAGIPLLERTRTGAIVTEAGQLLAARGRLLAEEASALVSSVRDLGSAPSGLLRVMLPVGLPPHYLGVLLGLIRSRYPKLSFRLRFGDHHTSGLLEDVDIAVHFGSKSPVGPWRSKEILRMRSWLIASRDYLARRGTPSTIAELAGHDLLSWEAPGEDGRVWPTRDGGGFPVAPVVLSTDVHLLRHYASAGLGIALVPDALLPDPALPEGSLVPVLPELVGGEVPLRVVVPTALAEVSKLKAILEMLEPIVGAL